MVNKKCEEGFCPSCGAELIYDDCATDDGQITYDVRCPECTFHGVEVYTISVSYDHTEGE